MAKYRTEHVAAYGASPSRSNYLHDAQFFLFNATIP